MLIELDEWSGTVAGSPHRSPNKEAMCQSSHPRNWELFETRRPAVRAGTVHFPADSFGIKAQPSIREAICARYWSFVWSAHETQGQKSAEAKPRSGFGVRLTVLLRAIFEAPATDMSRGTMLRKNFPGCNDCESAPVDILVPELAVCQARGACVDNFVITFLPEV